MTTAPRCNFCCEHMHMRAHGHAPAIHQLVHSDQHFLQLFQHGDFLYLRAQLQRNSTDQHDNEMQDGGGSSTRERAQDSPHC